MMYPRIKNILCGAILLALWPVGSVAAHSVRIDNEASLKTQVNQQVTELMHQQKIPGMAVAVLWRGNIFYYSFGQADVAKQQAVTADTIFEVGSISKTFAGVIGAMALERGDIKLTDPVVKHWPLLNNPQWQPITMQHLATYTAGGLPLMLPEQVTDEASLLQYYQQWQPQYQPGSQRVYANSSIGLFAHLAAKAGGSPYAEQFAKLTTTLQLPSTYLQVPSAAQANYAWGYNEGKAVHIGQGVLLDEAGGVKSSVRDIARWLQINMQAEQVSEPTIRAALVRAQLPYAKAGPMLQGLGWEMLNYPLQLSTLKAATDPSFIAGSPASLLDPTEAKRRTYWVHKTGATGGFSAYAAFIPSKQVGIVLLANQRYPNNSRVELAYELLESLQ